MKNIPYIFLFIMLFFVGFMFGVKFIPAEDNTLTIEERVEKLEHTQKANEQIIHDLNEHILNLQATVNQLDIEQDAVLSGLNEQYIEFRNVVFEGQALDEIKDIKAE